MRATYFRNKAEAILGNTATSSALTTLHIPGPIASSTESNASSTTHAFLNGHNQGTIFDDATQIVSLANDPSLHLIARSEFNLTTIENFSSSDPSLSVSASYGLTGLPLTKYHQIRIGLYDANISDLWSGNLVFSVFLEGLLKFEMGFSDKDGFVDFFTNRTINIDGLDSLLATSSSSMLDLDIELTAAGPIGLGAAEIDFFVATGATRQLPTVPQIFSCVLVVVFLCKGVMDLKEVGTPLA